MCSENLLERLFVKPITSSQAFGKPNEKCFCAFFGLIPVIISLVIVFLVIFRDLAEQFQILHSRPFGNVQVPPTPLLLGKLVQHRMTVQVDSPPIACQAVHELTRSPH